MITHSDIKNLKDKKYRKDNSLFLVEGEKFCADVLTLGVEIVNTITTDKNLTGYPNIEVIGEKMMASLSDTKSNQKVLCVCRFKPPSIDSQGDALILDDIQDPGNLGTLIRSALAFNFKDIYLVEGVDPFNSKVIRSSAGLITKVRLHECSFEDIKAHKADIAENFFVADMSGESIGKIRLPKTRVAVIIGNEGRGVSDRFFDLADKKISIPMSGDVESLNAGVAGSIIMQKLGERNVRTQ